METVGTEKSKELKIPKTEKHTERKIRKKNESDNSGFKSEGDQNQAQNPRHKISVLTIVKILELSKISSWVNLLEL